LIRYVVATKPVPRNIIFQQDIEYFLFIFIKYF
jgi:hypothetical protein